MTFASVYEMFTPLSTLRKQRFWDWCSGDDWRTWWSEHTILGSPTFQSVDAIDEGLEIISDNAAVHAANVAMNEKRHYSATASISIMVARRVTSTAISDILAGMHRRNLDFGVDHQSWARNRTDSSFIELVTADGSSANVANSTVAPHTNWMTYLVQNNSADNLLFLDGVLEVTNTANRPSSPMQLKFRVSGTTNSPRTGRIRYVEAYNT